MTIFLNILLGAGISVAGLIAMIFLVVTLNWFGYADYRKGYWASFWAGFVLMFTFGQVKTSYWD